MVKRILQDVIPPGRRSIRHIPLSADKKTGSLRENSLAHNTRMPKQNKSNMRWMIPTGVLVLLLAVVLGASWLFSSATVTVTPKQLTSAVEAVLQSSLSANEGLMHIIITATSSASETIPATKEADVVRKASGKIVVYNNFSDASQRLIKNTRFTAPDGRIYRIDSSIVVPGQKMENGKKVPGSIETIVYADSAGADYNLLLTDLKGDFSIPGFKGSPRYESFYARLKTDIKGGFVGRARIVDEATSSAASEKLKGVVADDLWKKIQASARATDITFKSLYKLEYQTTPEDAPDNNGVTIHVTGIASAVVFDVGTLSKVIAARTLPDYNGAEIVIKNLSDLDLTPRISENKNVTEENPLIVSVKGNAHFVWQFDSGKLAEDLKGKSKKGTGAVMSHYGAIERAEAVIKPFWRANYPSKADLIHITINLTPGP